MFSESYRGSCVIHGDPMKFSGKALEMLKKELEDASFLCEEWRDSYLDESGNRMTIEQIFNQDEKALAEFYRHCIIDVIVEFDAGCGEAFKSMILGSELCSGGDIYLGESDGKEYYLLHSD